MTSVWSDDRGSAFVEAATMIIFMFLVGVLIVEVGNVWYARGQAQQAAAAGARAAAVSSSGAAAGARVAYSILDSSGCFRSRTVSVSGGGTRESRITVSVSGSVRPRLSPWPAWAAGISSMAWSDVSARAYSMREGRQ